MGEATPTPPRYWVDLYVYIDIVVVPFPYLSGGQEGVKHKSPHQKLSTYPKK